MTLLRQDRPDEDIEQRTGIDLASLIELRATLAAAPSERWLPRLLRSRRRPDASSTKSR